MSQQVENAVKWQQQPPKRFSNGRHVSQKAGDSDRRPHRFLEARSALEMGQLLSTEFNK